MIPIFEPFLGSKERKNLERCIDSNWISSQGEFILEFEDLFAAYHGCKHAVATANCTAALHIVLKALGIGPGDEVICPDLTFIAPANMIVLSGAKLVLVDIDPVTLAIDPNLLEEKITSQTKAVIVVHQFGHAAPMDEILEIANRHGLKIIEDNAESIGGRFKGKLLGTLGDVACFSFFANKIITTGEGGAILTDDDHIAERSRILRDHGMSRTKRYHHVELGFNYRMTNMQAAVGLAQLEKLASILCRRGEQMEWYYHSLSNVRGVELRKFQNWCDPVHWLMTISLDRSFGRADCIAYMKECGIECRQMVNPVHRAVHFSQACQDEAFPQALDVSTRSLHLPSSTQLTKEQVGYIADAVKAFVKKNP
jgi:perosamine synthetase